MLNKCANTGCVTPFRRLEDGKLFVVEIEPSAASSTRATEEGRFFRHQEHYWLCDPCSSALTLSFEQNEGWSRCRWRGPRERCRRLRCAWGKRPASPRAEIVAGLRLDLGDRMRRETPRHVPRVQACTICGKENLLSRCGF